MINHKIHDLYPTFSFTQLFLEEPQLKDAAIKAIAELDGGLEKLVLAEVQRLIDKSSTSEILDDLRDALFTSCACCEKYGCNNWGSNCDCAC